MTSLDQKPSKAGQRHTHSRSHTDHAKGERVQCKLPINVSQVVLCVISRGSSLPQSNPLIFQRQFQDASRAQQEQLAKVTFLGQPIGDHATRRPVHEVSGPSGEAILTERHDGESLALVAAEALQVCD